MVGRVDVDVTGATCSTEVVITVPFEMLLVGLSVTIEDKLDPEFVEVNVCDNVEVF